MDGIVSNEGVVIIGTTNFLENLQKNLVRAGRLDQRIEFRPPGDSEVQKLFVRILSEDPAGIDTSGGPAGL